MEVIFTPLAQRQIKQLRNFIAKRSYTERANAFVGRIIDQCEKLRDYPKRGTVRDDIIDGLRVIGFERSISIAFVVTEKAVLIEGVFYRGQSIERALKPPPHGG